MNAAPEINLSIDTELLVIGYGNTLRQDDSVGPRVAEQIEALHLPGVRTLICDQLSPEHAELIAHARVTVFVDAVRGAPRHVRLQPVNPGTTTQLMAHAAEPGTMLALARDVYGRSPPAWIVAIPVARLGFGADISATARHGVDGATQAIERFATMSASHFQHGSGRGDLSHSPALLVGDRKPPLLPRPQATGLHPGNIAG